MTKRSTSQARKRQSWREVLSGPRPNYSHKTKAQLLDELWKVAARVADLEAQCGGQGEMRILRHIAEGTSHVGPGFFPSFVRSLASALGVRYAFVAECLDRPTTRVRTLAFWARDHLAENFDYEIEGTPCKQVLNGETPCYPCDVQKLFPADTDLVSLEAESYCGLPLRDASGQVIGHLAILDDHELAQDFCKLPAVQIFGARAASELDRRRAEAEKMAALGQLTAGIAHELNTPIGVVKSSACNLERCVQRIVAALEKNRTLDEVRADRDFQQSLDMIQDNNRVVSEASARIAKIVAGLKRFSVEESILESANVRDCVESTLALVSHQTHEGITVEKRLADGPIVACGPAALTQVLKTLLTNAAQAIEGPGTVTVETSGSDECAHIRISDTGRGINKDKLETLFDFTFTEKGARVGIGMGLASVYNIVHRCDGDVNVASEIGKGTTFTIRLPIHTRPKSSGGALPRRRQSAVQAG